MKLTPHGKPWLTEHQLDDLRDQILRQPNRTLLEHMRRPKVSSSKPRWIIMNEVLGEPDPTETMMGLLKKAASGVLAIFPCSRTPRTLRA